MKAGYNRVFAKSAGKPNFAAKCLVPPEKRHTSHLRQGVFLCTTPRIWQTVL